MQQHLVFPADTPGVSNRKADKQLSTRQCLACTLLRLDYQFGVVFLLISLAA